MSFSSKYIAFEGIDSCGKSTQARMFCEFLKNQGYELFCTKEPGGGAIDMCIRDILLHGSILPKAKMFMFLADRTIHMEMVREKLNTGSIVISDRSLFSTIAYQCFGDGLSLKFVEEANRYATDGLLPNLTFVIDVKIDTMDKRIKSKDSIESKGREFFKKVKEGYKYIQKQYNNVYVIDGERTQEEIFRDIIEIWINH